MNSNTICVKKTFPAKYLKYLSYGIHIMKQLYPADEEYQQKVAEYLKFSDSVNVIIADIESSLTDENETEVKELKKTLAKKPKRIRNKKPANSPSTITLTEQIVELANEPTIKRGPTPADDVEYVIAVSDSEGEEEVKPEVKPEVKEVVKEVVKPVAKKVAKKRTKKADIDDDPRPNPTWVHPIIPVYGSDSEDEEEPKVVVEEVKELPKVVVEEVKELPKVVVEEVKEVVVVEAVKELPKEVVAEEVKPIVKPVTKKVTKKVKKAEIPVPTPAEIPVPAEIVVPKVVVKEQLDVDIPIKKVSKPRVKKVVEKKPEEVQQPAVVVEELTEENEV
jgi:hypothetical protein